MKNTTTVKQHGLVVQYITSYHCEMVSSTICNLLPSQEEGSVQKITEIIETSVSKAVNEMNNYHLIRSKSEQMRISKQLTDMASSVDSTLREIQETAWELGDFVNANDDRVRAQRMQYREVLRLCATVRKIVGEVLGD